MTKPPATSPPPLRVAAYCRIAANSAEQVQLLQEQSAFYAGRIDANPDWRLAGIFADNGSSSSPCPEFQKMLRKCRQKKIDLILTPSLSRFSRSTADCFNTIEELQELGIAVISEQERLNTMDPDCDVSMSPMAVFARLE